MPERTTQFQQLRGQSKQLLQSSIQWADTCQRFETQCQRPNYNMIPNCMCLCQWLHKVGALLVLQNKDTQGLRTFRLFLKGIFPQLRNHIKKMLQELIVNRLSIFSLRLRLDYWSEWILPSVYIVKVGYQRYNQNGIRVLLEQLRIISNHCFMNSCY